MALEEKYQLVALEEKYQLVALEEKSHQRLTMLTFQDDRSWLKASLNSNMVQLLP